MNIWPFGKHKEEVRADTNAQTGEVVTSDVLLSALLGKSIITKKKALEIPTVQSCINLIAGTISSLPIKLYRENEDGSVEELADIQEVIYAILKFKKVSFSDFEKIRSEKVAKRGAFDKKIFLENVDEK